MPTPWQRDLEADAIGFERWLRTKLPDAQDLVMSPLVAPQSSGFSNETLLFDLRKDPHEMTDISDVPANMETVQRPKALLQDWQKKTDDKGVPWTAAKLRPKKKDLSDSKRARPRRADRWQPDWIVKKYFPPQPPRKRKK